MDTELIAGDAPVYALLGQFGMLEVSGADARAFLHAQLSNDIQQLPDRFVRRAGYCSAKGRLLASFLVVPYDGGFLLQLSGDIASGTAKRLAMFVLRSKVKVADATAAWAQVGVWGHGAAAKLASAGFDVPGDALQVTESDGKVLIALGPDRFLALGRPDITSAIATEFSLVAPQWWSLGEVRAGLPLIGASTQDLFVPQMANFELIGGIDFKKGCYPGQEIVARSQYLGKLKRRMYRMEIDAAAALGGIPAAGANLYGSEPQPIGTVVGAAPNPAGGYEALAVMQSSQIEAGGPIRLGTPDGPMVRIAPLPYAV